MDEEPMELSGEGGRMLSYLNDSESDMMVDSPVQVQPSSYSFYSSPQTAGMKSKFFQFSASLPAHNESYNTDNSFRTGMHKQQRRSLCNIKYEKPTLYSPMRRLSEPFTCVEQEYNNELNQKGFQTLPMGTVSASARFLDDEHESDSLILDKENNYAKSAPAKYLDDIKHEQSDKEKLDQNKNKTKSRKKRKIKKEKDKSAVKSKRRWCMKCFVLLFCVMGVVCAFLFHSTDQCVGANIDMSRLRTNFDDVYGQHIAIETILQIFQNFASENGIHSSPLVLSFHGWTGVGKNYVTRLITDSFNRKKVNLFLIPLHFRDDSKQDFYKKAIPEWIKGNLTTCVVNVFVFDEMDKATEGILAGLHSILTELKHPNQSIPQTLFLFLSNSKAGKINELLFSKLSVGRSRTSLQINEFMASLLKEADQEWYIELYKDNLVDLFIPFLPLNDEHVINCIKKDLLDKGRQPTLEMIEAVRQDLLYFKSTSGEQYSLTGCKRVSDKVNLHLSD